MKKEEELKYLVGLLGMIPVIGDLEGAFKKNKVEFSLLEQIPKAGSAEYPPSNEFTVNFMKQLWKENKQKPVLGRVTTGAVGVSYPSSLQGGLKRIQEEDDQKNVDKIIELFRPKPKPTKSKPNPKSPYIKVGKIKVSGNKRISPVNGGSIYLDPSIFTGKEDVWETLLGFIHVGLDIVGMAPGVVGMLSDGVNGFIYYLEGDEENVIMSAIAFDPIWGTAATATKYINKTTEFMEEVTKVTSQVKKAGGSVANLTQGITQEVVGDLLKKTGKESMEVYQIAFKKTDQKAVATAGEVISETSNQIIQSVDQALNPNNYSGTGAGGLGGEVPNYKRDNRVPIDKETVLKGKEYQKTSMKVKGAQVYKKGDYYYYRDTFHTGESAHLEVFDKRGRHLGEADPQTGILIPGTADANKTIKVK